jgi:hypothetical protein
MIGRAPHGAAPTHSAPDEPTLEELLAEPIVQQLMRRDRTDATTIRRLLLEAAARRDRVPPN